jgi:hypothetical protein
MVQVSTITTGNLQNWNTFRVGFLLTKYWTVLSLTMRECKFVTFPFLADSIDSKTPQWTVIIHRQLTYKIVSVGRG